MNNKFDELTKSLAQSATRRAALKKFGVGLAGMALACFGLANKTEAATTGCLPNGSRCRSSFECCRSLYSNRHCVRKPSAFSMSSDGSFTWSSPTRINQTPLNTFGAVDGNGVTSICSRRAAP